MDREKKYETAFVVARLLVSFGILVAIVSFVGWAFRDDLSQFGGWFVARFGIAGVVAGSFLADAFHFPLPPQFYFLTGIAGGYRESFVALAVLIGSELGGLTAFGIARMIAGRSKFLVARIEKPRRLITRMIERRGYFGLAITTLLPVSYCLLCLASGAMNLPLKAYGVIAMMRIPRLAISYFIIMAAWNF